MTRQPSSGGDLKAVAAATYATTADHFDDPALSFWDRIGERTVSRTALRPGDSVLDACCGTGASALPAARAVGPQGAVLGIDVSEPALTLARAKAASAGLRHLEFRVGDIETTGLPSDSFDAVVCVFGIFFLPDMVAGTAELWRLVRPGGRLAITIWGPRLFEPATTAFWAAVQGVRPDLVGGFHPWTRLAEPGQLEDLFRQAGVPGAHAQAEAGTHPLASPEDWWTIVMGTGYRATVEKLSPEEGKRVRAANLTAIRERGVLSVETNAVYGTAAKGA